MGVIPNPKMAFIFPNSCILALIFPIFMKYFPKCLGKGSFPKSHIKSLHTKHLLNATPLPCSLADMYLNFAIFEGYTQRTPVFSTYAEFSTVQSSIAYTSKGSQNLITVR